VEDGASAINSRAQASTRLLGSSHSIFGTEPTHTPVLIEGSCDGPTLTLSLCGQKTQLRFHKASVDGITACCTDMLSKNAGINWPRRKHVEHPTVFSSLAHVLLAPHRLRCKWAATRRSVLMRCGTPKLSCCLPVDFTGTVCNNRVSTLVRFARAQDVH
jgi:hypothetical protein